jgi:uncharacterized membrane protein YdbT with pleckstrin-like domain
MNTLPNKINYKAHKQPMLEQGEQIVTVIKRHPIGLISMYLQATAALGAIALLVIVLAPDLLEDNSSSAFGFLAAIFALIVFLVLAVLALATSLYNQSQLVVTNRGIIQTLQKGMFNKKISRLSMSDVEDVTAEHKGIFQTIFNYGTLHIETSGELKNFAFKFCPQADKYATQIIEARHQYSAKDVD